LLFVVFPVSLCRSEGLKEKKATSDPEIKAEKASKIIITTKLIASPVVKG
jgi:hypothetical protein